MLSVEPTLWPDAFAISDVVFGDLAAGYELTGRQLTIDLPQVLEPGCAVEVDLAFRLTVPPIGEGVSAYRGFLGV